MRWIRRILGLLLLVVILFLAVGFFLPADYRVERSVVVEATPAQVHRHVRDLRAWEEWAVWQHGDPSLRLRYGPRTAGVGAQQHWTSDDGVGKLTVTASDPQRGMDVDIEYGQGDYLSVASLRYQPVTGGTRVTWVLEGEAGGSPVERWVGLCMGLLAGPEFEESLIRLAEVVEASAHP